MNVEIGTEAAQFPEKEYINGIAVAVYSTFSAWYKLYFLHYGSLKGGSPCRYVFFFARVELGIKQILDERLEGIG